MDQVEEINAVLDKSGAVKADMIGSVQMHLSGMPDLAWH
jgi:hypothetical protein